MSLKVSVKLTIVPSGIALPLQSRTGAVSTSSFEPFGRALIVIRQGSPGTSSIIRVLDAVPIRATNFAVPSFGVESISAQAKPFFVVTLRLWTVPAE